MEPESDEALAAEMARGDPVAFRALYARYEAPIFSFLRRLAGDREAALDLMQETFTRVWIMARLFDPARGRFKSWLFTIALNLTRSERGKKRYGVIHVGPEAAESVSAETPPDALVVQAETERRVASALACLPPLLREVVVMKVYQQLKFREIAEITRTPEGTLKARFHHAVASLRDLLREPGGQA
jgi:RNA polymerase sigma-70 factor (ECF subfamily)